MLTASDLFISLFALWSFILSLPLPFHAPGSIVILCSFTHLFPSFLLMLPVVHRGAGSAPKQAESQWRCQSSAESQSHLNLSTAQPPLSLPLHLSLLFPLYLSSLLQFYFLLFPPSLLYKLLHFCLFSYIPHCLFSASVCSQTHCFRTGLTLNPHLQSQLQPPDYTAVDEVKHHTSWFWFGRTNHNVILKRLRLWFQPKLIPRQEVQS